MHRAGAMLQFSAPGQAGRWASYQGHHQVCVYFISSSFGSHGLPACNTSSSCLNELPRHRGGQRNSGQFTYSYLLLLGGDPGHSSATSTCCSKWTWIGPSCSGLYTCIPEQQQFHTLTMEVSCSSAPWCLPAIMAEECDTEYFSIIKDYKGYIERYRTLKPKKWPSCWSLRAIGNFYYMGLTIISWLDTKDKTKHSPGS